MHGDGEFVTVATSTFVEEVPLKSRLGAIASKRVDPLSHVVTQTCINIELCMLRTAI